MERKEGEIFEFKGDKYIIKKGCSCVFCDMSGSKATKGCFSVGACSASDRSDDTTVIAKFA